MNMEQQLKQLTQGSIVYALIKGEKITYAEGAVNSVSAPRREMPKYDMTQPLSAMSAVKEVVDLTFTINGATYTEVVDANQAMFGTSKLGAVALVATSVDAILRELRATKKNKEDYLAETETGIPRAKEYLKECDLLIARLDTSFAEKQALNERMDNLEGMLRRVLEKLDK